MRANPRGMVCTISALLSICCTATISSYVLACGEPCVDQCGAVVTITYTPCQTDALCDCSGAYTETRTYSCEGGCCSFFKHCNRIGSGRGSYLHNNAGMWRNSPTGR